MCCSHTRYITYSANKEPYFISSDAYVMFGRVDFSWLLYTIAVTNHVTRVQLMMASKFELVTSPSGMPWCSVDQPSMVLEMASEDIATTCAMECLKYDCCLLYQFKKNSLLCELFDYTTTNFDVIPSCSSQCLLISKLLLRC